ncbi:hypothetical protein BBO99_00001721 [Phytophthora kernoviae]|uniref:Uncharacterized protein n=2 Tax=Phytophthora kernoviae TaxID=325452 RepID=A0A3R7NKV6_9STRA|nr:hypothetical protein G195_002296 [Phytophthora kernoviae 00238/432]KAG2530934.1 hypothetical protein JM16_001429 [Phytophthora kernoviae]KAG2532003.1 hypothetical protein JM18_001510 [Phytophthora kernoviae]RLN36739.1 hypothetical protein BBI17_001527 [Phytophthora kernoviae]RLN83904.1 hypothetical protein BBO99_00001721 [Phytophthora kernoviae]
MICSVLVAAAVDGHGYMTNPTVTFTASAGDPTQHIGTIQASDSGFSGKFDDVIEKNVAAFTQAFGSSSYTSLKEFVNEKATVTVTGATLTCGSCDPNEPAQPLPESTVEWSPFFTESHVGPCEVWCDEMRVFQNDNCAGSFSNNAPAQMPYDRDACMGSSVLTFYWMALHSSTWQVYVNCAPLEKTASTGATSKYAVGGSNPSNTATTTDAPSSATAIPTVTSATQTTPMPMTTSAPSTTSVPSTMHAPPSTADGSDCGSYGMADSKSDCGSYGMADSESKYGSNDKAGKGSDDAQYYTGSKTDIDFSTFQGSMDAGKVEPQ